MSICLYLPQPLRRADGEKTGFFRHRKDLAKVDSEPKDKNGRTPLWYAEKWHEVVVKLLLEKGADNSQII